MRQLLAALWLLVPLLALRAAALLRRGGEQSPRSASHAPSGLPGTRGAGRRPLVYVYGLGKEFRERGQVHNETLRQLERLEDECLTRDCAFGGPPTQIRGHEIWSTNQNNVAWMMYYRLLRSSRRTRDVNKADLFFVPAWGRGVVGGNRCANFSDLFDALRKENPLLESEPERVGSRHILVDPRLYYVCPYFFPPVMVNRSLSAPKFFARINPETVFGFIAAKDLATNQTVDPDMCVGGRNCQVKPGSWHAFPYPTLYHGSEALAPARTRPRGRAKYLWNLIGGSHGKAVALRRSLHGECAASARCSHTEFGWREMQADRANPRRDISFPNQLLVETMLDSTFCPQPPGDSLSRKGIIDAIVMGCVPVVFEEEQLSLWKDHLSREEFASLAVLVPEQYLLGTANQTQLSLWGKEVPPDELVFKRVIRGVGLLESSRQAVQPPLIGVGRKLGPYSPHALEPVLAAISEAELRAKQDALAQLAGRVIIGLEDGERDSLQVLLESVDAGAAAVQRRAEEENARLEREEAERVQREKERWERLQARWRLEREEAAAKREAKARKRKAELGTGAQQA